MNKQQTLDFLSGKTLKEMPFWKQTVNLGILTTIYQIAFFFLVFIVWQLVLLTNSPIEPTKNTKESFNHIPSPQREIDCSDKLSLKMSAPTHSVFYDTDRYRIYFDMNDILMQSAESFGESSLLDFQKVKLTEWLNSSEKHLKLEFEEVRGGFGKYWVGPTLEKLQYSGKIAVKDLSSHRFLPKLCKNNFSQTCSHDMRFYDENNHLVLQEYRIVCFD